jgi:hypothetical protein
LACVAGEAIEQKAFAGVLLGDAQSDHAEDHLVGHQLSGVHVLLRLLPHLGALRYLGPQHVAGGDVCEREVGLQALGLSTLAGTRRTEQDEVRLHH